MLRDPIYPGSELDVFPDGQPREQRVALEYHTAAGLDPRDRMSLQQHSPRGGREEPRNHIEDGGLAAAGSADEGHDLALMNLV